ncbi:hypothetical protein N8778_00140 [Verrucomicrobia bacterium]|nr:hypothetical protein [Verrucomicrobiota bacterium]
MPQGLQNRFSAHERPVVVTGNIDILQLNDPFFMRYLQCCRNLLKDLQAFLNRHLPLTKALLESVSIDSFQNQKGMLIFLIKTMNRSAIETIQLHSHHRFALKAGHAFLAADKLKRPSLDLHFHRRAWCRYHGKLYPFPQGSIGP